MANDTPIRIGIGKRLGGVAGHALTSNENHRIGILGRRNWISLPTSHYIQWVVWLMPDTGN